MTEINFTKRSFWLKCLKNVVGRVEIPLKVLTSIVKLLKNCRWIGPNRKRTEIEPNMNRTCSVCSFMRFKLEPYLLIRPITNRTCLVFCVWCCLQFGNQSPVTFVMYWISRFRDVPDAGVMDALLQTFGGIVPEWASDVSACVRTEFADQRVHAVTGDRLNRIGLVGVWESFRII